METENLFETKLEKIVVLKKAGFRLGKLRHRFEN